MRTYELKDFLPSWHFDPATTRQLKVLHFFGVSINPPPTKGRASGIIGRLFTDAANKHLWLAYVFSTGDEDDSCLDLRAHDKAALAKVVIPEDWRPRRSTATRVENREIVEQLVSSLLKEGSPFDDPLPQISIAGNCFCLTGKFGFGTRSLCQQAVVSRGGSVTEGITSKTDALVIGSDASSRWSHGSYGDKVEAAMINRMQHGKPVIIPEAFWQELLAEDVR